MLCLSRCLLEQPETSLYTAAENRDRELVGSFFTAVAAASNDAVTPITDVAEYAARKKARIRKLCLAVSSLANLTWSLLNNIKKRQIGR